MANKLKRLDDFETAKLDLKKLPKPRARHYKRMMKPLKEKKKPVVEIMYGDCRELLKHLTTHSFDACITDPPYYKTNKAIIGTSQEGYGTSIPEYKEWLWEVKRVVKPNGHILVWENPYNMDLLLQAGKELGLPYETFFVWKAVNRHQFGASQIPINKFDVCVWWVKEPATKWTYNGGRRGITDVFEAPVVGGLKAKVPGAKPLDIIKTLVQLFTNEGGWVLDPFAGSGTTARACLETNRNCVTMELREGTLSKFLDSRTLKGVRRFF